MRPMPKSWTPPKGRPTPKRPASTLPTSYQRHKLFLACLNRHMLGRSSDGGALVDRTPVHQDARRAARKRERQARRVQR